MQSILFQCRFYRTFTISRTCVAVRCCFVNSSAVLTCISVIVPIDSLICSWYFPAKFIINGKRFSGCSLVLLVSYLFVCMPFCCMFPITSDNSSHVLSKWQMYLTKVTCKTVLVLHIFSQQSWTSHRSSFSWWFITTSRSPSYKLTMLMLL